ncbi:DUF4153 domain-containing protein [Devosia nitrariae]|uniref:DUF4173 domain-containing protein n=1 Tax=Devosia nitrariae TaxID=2071872 RepID=A0ABQ5W264_9HYPH|nr:DUF4173 domain-containing protein [Devosia nitrariae]GLQ54103.1 hypothetical protein GCM10010862_13620 [Devosia nitrariae]
MSQTENQDAIPAEQVPFGAATTVAFGVLAVAASDYLLFVQRPGINLFIWTLVVAACIVGSCGRSVGPQRLFWPAAGVLVAALPLVEAPSLPGWLSALFGLSILALACGDLLPGRLTGLPEILLRYGLLAPVRLLQDVARAFRSQWWVGVMPRAMQGIVVWLVPVLFGIVFLSLFGMANPVIEQTLRRFTPETALALLDPGRMFFWLFAAALVWPLLAPRLLRRSQLAAVTSKPAEQKASVLFGEAAITRSLIVFNALFAVQTLLDVAYLWGGMALPEGMTYAEYAHRGAYPLVATALLAAGFVLAAMREGGPGEKSGLIRVLVYAWIGQNVLLCLSSMLRLKLYVETYLLTEMRIAAGLWMALVALGLILILVRILQHRSNAWLVTANLTALGIVLYVCAFVDFAAVIARYNVEQSAELGGGGVALDLDYVWRLGPDAIPALDVYIARVEGAEARMEAARTRAHLATSFARRSDGWRGWSFRDARLQDYLLQHPQVATSPQSDNN